MSQTTTKMLPKHPQTSAQGSAVYKNLIRLWRIVREEQHKNKKTEQIREQQGQIQEIKGKNTRKKNEWVLPGEAKKGNDAHVQTVVNIFRFF